MSNRTSRFGLLKEIPVLARLDHRHFLNASDKPVWFENLTRKERRKLNAETRKIAREYNNILSILYNSGVGFPVDQTTRQMAAEYTHRFASSGTENLPSSFNYFEPFCELKIIKGSVAHYLSLTPETNHLFNASDFFDFLTSRDSNGFTARELLRLPEAQTFHFTNNGIIQELTFFDASGREYIFSGFSMVRRGESIHWFLIAGEKLTSEEWELRAMQSHEIIIDDISPWKRAFLKEVFERTGATTGVPMKLEGTESAVRTLVAGEFDLANEKHIGKSIFIETENSFEIFSDDPAFLVGLAFANQKRQIIDKAMERIRQANILWNMAEGFFQLPQYFEARVTVSKKLIQGQGKQHGLKGRGGKGIKADYVAVEAVAIADTDASSAIRRISMPLYSTETEGHWRRLRFGQTGRDRDGNPVAGKTWVKRSSPWRDEKKKDSIVYVKDCLSIAKSRIEELYTASDTPEATKPKQEIRRGELYVLRCTLMQEEIYKVGWTSGTAAERAKQLSTATGVPLAFIVVESWIHSDPEALEAEVHAQLSPYRVNYQREFFRLNFLSIREVIMHTIQRVAQVGGG